jgi:hypothetical protein
MPTMSISTKTRIRRDRNVCVIELKRPTRERLKDASTRRQSYDDLINELLKLKEQSAKD